MVWNSVDFRSDVTPAAAQPKFCNANMALLSILLEVEANVARSDFIFVSFSCRLNPCVFIRSLHSFCSQKKRTKKILEKKTPVLSSQNVDLILAFVALSLSLNFNGCYFCVCLESI